ncbi:hypothetical protein B0O99DRAFT_503947 [Bisporella sp. PMI_857]|nr:hypothetical protein B0O99DRAFT_503947 [Bisporella sp. PMI_857]
MQKQIDDLQAQVRLLTQKATAAVDKWADYEDEIQRLRAENSQNTATSTEPRRGSAISSVPFDERPNSPTRPQSNQSNLQNRLSSFLTARKSTPNLKGFPLSPSTNELEEALRKEQSLRAAAEGKLNEASGELEELSAQLFMQANEMVATERKARAKLEERVELLERRDVEKRKRLERLEGAVQRIERVRGLLGPET